MRNLRDILRGNVENETLREYLGEEQFSTADHQERERILNILRRRGEIEREIDLILNTFLEDIQKTSRPNKKRKLKAAIYAAINLILTIGIGYAVNETAWTFVWVLGVINVFVYILSIFFDD